MSIQLLLSQNKRHTMNLILFVDSSKLFMQIFLVSQNLKCDLELLKNETQGNKSVICLSMINMNLK